jgi:hypothetical protein
LGIILHATRSGTGRGQIEEYDGTVRYVRDGAGGLAWHVTVGPDRVAMHMDSDVWGWNAREHSSNMLAIEIAQSNLGGEIDDATLRAVAWWILNVARARWPTLRLDAAGFANHSDLPAGVRDGKSDVEPRGQHGVRDRLLRVLNGA